MALSSNRIGHRPFTAATPGSNPAGVTNGRVAQMVSAPACHAGGRGFNPRHGRQRPLRLIGQDASLSSWKRGFKSRRGHQYGSVLKW